MPLVRPVVARLVAPALVLVLALGSALPLATHASGDDPCDGPSAAVARGASVRAAQAPAASQHCEICHFLRLLRGTDAVALAPLPQLSLAAAPDSPAVIAGARLTVAGVPARAPPA